MDFLSTHGIRIACIAPTSPKLGRRQVNQADLIVQMVAYAAGIDLQIQASDVNIYQICWLRQFNLASKVIGGSVYHLWYLYWRSRPVLTESFRKKAFNAFHELSHLRIHATHRLVTKRWLWHGMNKAINWC